MKQEFTQMIAKLRLHFMTCEPMIICLPLSRLCMAPVFGNTNVPVGTVSNVCTPIKACHNGLHCNCMDGYLALL